MNPHQLSKVNLNPNTTIPAQHRPHAIHTLRWVSVAALCVALFAILAVALIHAGPSDWADVSISKFVQSFRSPVLDAFMITATYLCSWQVVIAGGVLGVLYLLVQRMWFAAAAMVISLVGNVLIVGGIKGLMQRVRPDQTHALLPASGSTFPSGHTFSAFAFYGLLALLYVGQGQRVGHKGFAIGLASFVVVAVGVSRIYVGAHWPSDVLGSAFLGSGWLALLGLLLAALRERVPQSSSQTSNRTAQRWARIMVLFWTAFIVVYAILHSPAHPSAAIA